MCYLLQEKSCTHVFMFFMYSFTCSDTMMSEISVIGWVLMAVMSLLIMLVVVVTSIALGVFIWKRRKASPTKLEISPTTIPKAEQGTIAKPVSVCKCG